MGVNALIARTLIGNFLLKSLLVCDRVLVED